MIALDALAARRRIMDAAAARRRPTRVRPAAPPSTAILAYTQLARRVLAALDAAILDALRDEGVVRTDAAADGPLPEGIGGRLRRRLAGLIRRLTAPAALTRELDALAKRTNDLSRTEWRAQVKAAVGVDLTDDPDVAPKLLAFRRENVRLIRSLAREKADRVASILSDAGSGTRVETIAKRIREETDATPQRAALIARDQVLKLNAEVTQARHEAAGLDSYIWRTSRDERVRKEHRELEGRRFRYDDPPVVSRSGDRANPGEWFRCRCIAEPLIEGLDDLPGLVRTDAAWNEADHDRDRGGRFTSGSGGRGPMQAKPKGSSGPPQGQATSPSSSNTKPPHVLKAEADHASYAASLTPKKRKAFNAAVSGLYANSGRAKEDVAHFVTGAVNAAGRGQDPAAYLDAATAIAARKITPETLQTLGANAVGKHAWDLAWVQSTNLSDSDLDFLAGDRNTAWPKFKKGAELVATLKKNPKPPANDEERKRRERVMAQANLTVRGVAGELLARDRADGKPPPPLVAGFKVGQRQVTPAGSDCRLDFALHSSTPPPRTRVMEVKAATPKRWGEWFDAYAAREAGATQSKAQKKAAGKIDSLVEQMKAATSGTTPGHLPVLALSGDMEGAPALATLRSHLKVHGLLVEIVTLPENDIVGTGRRLRGDLGLVG